MNSATFIIRGIYPGRPLLHPRQFRHMQLCASIGDELDFDHLALACAINFAGWIGYVSLFQLSLRLADCCRDGRGCS
jgi:hypothetical protein